MGCITTARFNMVATLLRAKSVVDEQNPEEGAWHYEWVQDPDSGAMVQVKVYDETSPNNDPTTDADGIDFDCMARGIIDGGIRVAGTTETFDKLYEATDWVKIIFPAKLLISRRDRITNIRDRKTGTIIWAEEEGAGGPTVFNVQGITPIVDPFGHHIENFALCQRAEVQ